MSAVAVAVSRIFSVRRLVGARVQPLTLAAVLVVIVLFKLAISDGGRHAPTLALAQVAIYLSVIMLLAGGAVRRTAVTGALVAVVAVAAATALWSVRPEATLRALLQWLMYLGISTVVGSSLSSFRAVRWFADVLIVIAGWLCLIALFMFWGAGNPAMRWFSTFYWPNPFAAFLLLALPVEVFRFLHAPTGREALAHGSLAGLLGVALVLTYSRGAWSSLLVSVPVAITVLRPPSWPRALSKLMALGVAIVAVVVVLTLGAGSLPGQELLGRAASVTDAADQSVQGRLHFWRSAWAIFLDHPLGTGAGTFGSVHAAYQQDARFYSKDAHNLYLQTAAEMGVPGLLALAAVLASVAMAWRRVLRRTPDTDAYALTAGAGIALLAFFLHSGMEMNWMFPANPAAAFVLIGMLAAIDRLTATAAAAPVDRRWRAGAITALSFATIIVALWHAAGGEFVRGQEFARAGNWQSAAQAYARAVRLNPLDPRTRAAQAAALMQVRPAQVTQAESALRQAMRLDRVNASHPLQLASLLMTQPGWTSRQAEAEQLLLRAIALDPLNRPEAYRLLGRLYLERGEPDRAERIYREAAARYRGRGLASGMAYFLLWPEVAGLRTDWAALLMSQGRGSDAVPVLWELVQEDPHWTPAYLLLARAYLQMGRPGDADRVLRDGTEKTPENLALWIRWRSLPWRRTPVWEQ